MKANKILLQRVKGNDFVDRTVEVYHDYSRLEIEALIRAVSSFGYTIEEANEFVEVFRKNNNYI
ncbi:hypothetical protein Phi19:1_gp083 [Cellulophaga phage phi19:1]|uniref:Uncharacterized protein n=1 Tax=Cellulophaga phage phi19:1 TaxID=1327970 RepID=R9ZZJ0_9CAUD|nr:hypothetical protein Phi19:1_gp083 [Cellulophaga phage phi19:1]AGO47373.1 hypothetical protein Phi19:1_gp083 [Cellulophaga phage phi19:1]